MNLRPYQMDTLQAMSDARRRGHRSILVSMPTGAGKTYMAATGIILPALARGQRCVFVVHLREVVLAAARDLADLGIPVEVVMAGVRSSAGAAVRVCSLMTLASRDAETLLRDCDVLIIDEAHRAKAATYRRLVHAVPAAAAVIGLTATPIRSDGASLAPPFEALVSEVYPSALVRDGHLVPIAAYGAASVDVSRLEYSRKHRDYEPGSMERAYLTPRLIADPVDSWHRHAKGLRTIAFTSGRAHSASLQEAFERSGVRTGLLDATTPKGARARVLTALKRHELDVLLNVDVLTEGFDEPLVGCVQVVRATASLGRWLQIAGRGLRPIQARSAQQLRDAGLPVPVKRELVLIDHGANLQRHGSPLEDRRWSLSDSERNGRPRLRTGTLRWHQCPSCGYLTQTPMGGSCVKCNAALNVPGVLDALLVRFERGIVE